MGPRHRRIPRLPALALLLAALVACAGPPPVPMLRKSEIPPMGVNVLDGVIVDLDATRAIVTVKEDQTFLTWTVAVEPVTHYWSPTRQPIALSDLKIGDRIEIRGRSRVQGIMTADDVDLVAVRQRPGSGSPLR